MKIEKMSYEDFPLQSYDKIRFGDTDRQGHVNNAVFSTYMETGRTELIHQRENILDENCTIVMAHLSLDMVGEITWPGTVELGTAVKAIGNSSIRLHQHLFQNGKLVAKAETVMVQMDKTTRKSKPLTDDAKEALKKYIINR